MKFRWDKKYLYWGVTAFLVIVASMIFYNMLFGSSALLAGVGRLFSILMPIIDGLVFAYLMNPILNFYELRVIPLITDRIKFKKQPESAKFRRRIRYFSVFFTFITTVFIIYIFFQLVIPQIINSIQSIVKMFPVYIKNLTTWIDSVFQDYPQIDSAISKYVGDYTEGLDSFLRKTVLPNMNTVVTSVSLSIVKAVRFAWNLIIGLIISIYVMANRELFAAQCKKILFAFLSKRVAANIISGFEFTHKTFSSFIVGKIVDSAIIGIICFIITSIIGTPYHVLVSVIVGVTNIIPVFGPFIGGIPCALLILMVDPWQCLYFIIMILVIQQVDGNFIGPKILGESTGLSSFWVIFALTLGGGLFGVVGMFLGIPIFAVFYATLKRRVNRQLRFKSLSENTNDYFRKFNSLHRDEFINSISVNKKSGDQDITD